MGKFMFFGAGKKGKEWIRYCRDFGVEPEGVLDNNKDLYGKLCEGIVIYDPRYIRNYCFDYIFITCAKENEVYHQLLKLGIAKEKIVIGNHNFLNHLLYCAAEKFSLHSDNLNLYQSTDKKKILLDLQNGMVLGGVESWSYEVAERLKKEGYKGVYLTTDITNMISLNKTYPTCVLKYRDIIKETDKIYMGIHKIIENLPCTVICNFPQYTFWSVCIIKMMYPNLVRVIAVQHNDEQIYYDTYGLWKYYVDRYLVISSRIEHKLLSYGINKDSVCHLKWQVSCDEILDRYWSKKGTCIQIGYAGRVTVTQKRVDLLLSVALKLIEKGINFHLNIAGTGDYRETLSQRIQERNLWEYVNLIGYIDRENIPDFWSKQDIMISCSEWEGHSISQSEAMAAGAVPVITDVSGARDDITDKYNGYVVSVGDVNSIVDRICDLYYNRDKLERMGKCAHDTIYKKQRAVDQTAFWNKLLKEVWEL